MRSLHIICLALLLRRDYFGRPDASLSSSFSPQGLFRSAGFISILFFFSTGIISTARIHLYLALFLHRDYFGRPDASLAPSFSPQGLFRPARFISSLIFCATGIISASRMHLYLALFLHRDYFGRPVSSLSCALSPQGLFRPSQTHLYIALLFHRDYFHRPDSSPACFFLSQGLFRPATCIPVWLFYSTGIISADRMHLYLALFHRRDYLAPVRCIPIWLFCATRIILPRSDTSPSLKTSLPGRSVNFRFVLL